MSLQINNLNKSYGRNHILKDINIDSPPGEFLVLVGSSGCGKSTLLSCIGGLEEFSSGTIYNEGKDITHLGPKERDIAMVFQSYALYPNMTVRENISFGLKMKKTPKEQIAKKVDEVSEILQIQPLLDRKPAQLSGGQKQRVAMGRAIARAPSLYLFDEPLSNLDAKLRVDMRLQIKRLHQQVGKNIVYVTHDQIEAMTLADRIAIMKEGDIVQLGTPDELYLQPKNVFVAKFIGSNPINLLSAKVQTKQDKLYIDIKTPDGPITTLDLPAKLAAMAGKEIIIGIRPEIISNNAEGDKVKVKITSPVLLEEKTGPDTFVFTKWNNTEIKARCQPQAQMPKHLDLYFNPEQVLFFDPHQLEQPIIK